MRSGIGKLVVSGLVVVLAALIAVYAFSYLSFAETGFLTNKEPGLRENILWQAAFYLHVTFGGVALLLGGFQFIEPLRNRFISLHRRFGKIYVLSVFISAAAGLGIALFADAGPISKIGFALLAVAWFYTNYKAFSEIKKGNILEHRAWMIRCYSLTFAAVTLRFILPFELAVLGLDFPTAYRIVAWLCWVPNLLVAELLVYRLRAANQLIGSAAA